MHIRLYSVFIMRELSSDELLLQGRLQIDTAREALLSTGINPSAEKQMATILDVHDKLSTTADQKDLTVYLKGGETERTKTDIIMGLELLEQRPDARSDTREAARGLLELLKQK